MEVQQSVSLQVLPQHRQTLTVSNLRFTLWRLLSSLLWRCAIRRDPDISEVMSPSAWRHKNSEARRHRKQKTHPYFCFSAAHPIALYYHTLQNMPAVATKLILLLYFFIKCFGPCGPSSGGIQHQLLQLQYYGTLERQLMLYSTWRWPVVVKN
jgi:hypothetical protein